MKRALAGLLLLLGACSMPTTAVRTVAAVVPIETMTTDAHGWYLSTYWHRGRTAEYQIVLLDPAGGDLESVTVTVGRSLKFGLADFAL